MSNCDVGWCSRKHLGFRCSRERASMVKTRRIRLYGGHFLRQCQYSVVPHELLLDYVLQRMATILSSEHFYIHVQGVVLLKEYISCLRLALCGPPVQRLPSPKSDTWEQL